MDAENLELEAFQDSWFCSSSRGWGAGGRVMEGQGEQQETTLWSGYQGTAGLPGWALQSPHISLLAAVTEAIDASLNFAAMLRKWRLLGWNSGAASRTGREGGLGGWGKGGEFGGWGSKRKLKGRGSVGSLGTAAEMGSSWK